MQNEKTQLEFLKKQKEWSKRKWMRLMNIIIAYLR
jgi:hypothetical protein